MNPLIVQIAQELKKGRPVVEALICEHSGSTPRSAGAGMLVFADGSIAGSVGGGLLEAKVQRKAMELLENPEESAVLLDFDFSNSQAAAAGMICGGALQVFLQRIEPADENASTFTQAAELLQKGRRLVMLSCLQQDAQKPLQVTQRHPLSKDFIPEDLPPELVKEAFAASKEGTAGMFTWKGRRYLAAPHLENGTLLLVGAGHVALHTAAAAVRVGFSVIVMDDRSEFANNERFPEAQRIVVLESFATCFQNVPLDENSYVVVVTRGHLHDKTVLSQVLRSPAAYLGMIGSTRKRDAIYDALEKEGFARSEFERVHCPIGIPIGAETPEEIAVSIVAELIRHRALRRGNSKGV